jgi:tetratricopeptide (TPR) repeat protein
MNFKLFIPLFTTLFLLVSHSNAQATFPGKNIAHWDLSESQDRNDPEYQKLPQLVQNKKYAEAMAILENKIQQDPKAGTPVILKALVLNEMGQYKAAQSAIMAGQFLELRHPALHYGFCMIYRNLGKAEYSERACLIAVDQHRNSPEAHYELAQTLAAQGKMERANKELGFASQLDPKTPLYHYERGLNFSYLNRLEESEAAFKQALAIDENHLDANYQLAYLYATQGKKKLAEKHALKVLETRRDHPNVTAANLLLKYISSDSLHKLPKKITAHLYHMGRSKSLYQEGKFGLALIEIETAAKLQPNDIKVQEILIGLSSLLLRLEEEEKSIHQFIKLAGDDKLSLAKGYEELADIRVMQGKLAEAKLLYEKAKPLGKSNNLAEITLKEFPEQIPETKPLSKDELFIRPTEALNRKGEIFAHYKMYDRAIAIYSMVIRMDPNHLQSMLNIATAHYNKGMPHRAISILERLLVTHPSHENILAHRLLLARSYVKKGDRGNALKNLDIAVRLNPAVKKLLKTDHSFDDLKDQEAFKQLIE